MGRRAAPPPAAARARRRASTSATEASGQPRHQLTPASGQPRHQLTPASGQPRHQLTATHGRHNIEFGAPHSATPPTGEGDDFEAARHLYRHLRLALDLQGSRRRVDVSLDRRVWQLPAYLDSMRAQGWELGELSYKVSADACARLGHGLALRKVMAAMQLNGVDPPLSVRFDLLQAFAMRRNATECRRAFAELTAAHPPAACHPRAWVSLISAESGVRGTPPQERWLRVLAAWRDARAAGCPKNRDTLHTLLSAAPSWRSAGGVLSAMRRRAIQPDAVTFSILLKLCAEDGDPAAAEAVGKKMDEKGIRKTVTHWTALMSAYKAAGDVRGSVRVWRRMERAQVEPSAVTYTALVAACVRQCAAGGDPEESVRIAESTLHAALHQGFAHQPQGSLVIKARLCGTGWRSSTPSAGT
eukprot:TRINITY_DN19288_c0_g1_i1.p1 TRINITY_DN19288_c0_g1~~TRINITY_DN19288_c0_g1_i1.p1  ORF type:complete len:436 (+),score=87.85 TRINITY_DN19288_c0_g1_i1:66-1310(+)